MGTDLRNALTFHGDPGRFKIEQKYSDMPGSPVSLMHAISMNKYNSPYGSERNSADEFAGGASSSLPLARTIGRAVGTAFIPYGGMAKSIYGATQNQGNTSQSSSEGASDIFDFAQNHYQPSTTQSNQNMMLGTDPNLYNANVEKLKDQGRYGDDQLLHVSTDELNQLKSTGKITQNPSTGLPEAFSLGSLFSGGGGNSGLLGPITSLIGNNQNKQDLTGIANTASNASNPLAAGQRQPYQSMLSSMFTPGGAENFFNTDPSVQAQKKMISDQMMADFGKSGNMPLTSIMGSAQLANAFGGQYNQRIQDLTTLGGFNQGNPYGGMPYSSLITPVNAQNQGANAGFGSLVPGLANGLQGLFSGGGGIYSGGSGANTGFDMPGAGGGIFE